jgi:hypothetical protein
MGFTSDQVKKAVRALKNIRPAYTTLLDFYERIFEAQEESAGRIHIDPVTVSGELLAVKIKEKFPLINLDEFAIDAAAAEDLFSRICRIAEEAGGDMSGSPKPSVLPLKPESSIQVAFHRLLKKMTPIFEKTQASLKSTKKPSHHHVQQHETVSALCARSFHPAGQNRRMERILPDLWKSAGLSMFEGEGERFLFAFLLAQIPPAESTALSARTWMPKRSNIFTARGRGIPVIFATNAKIHQNDRYPENGPDYYPPLEQVATLHLESKPKKRTGKRIGAWILIKTSNLRTKRS